MCDHDKWFIVMRTYFNNCGFWLMCIPDFVNIIGGFLKAEITSDMVFGNTQFV